MSKSNFYRWEDIDKKSLTLESEQPFIPFYFMHIPKCAGSTIEYIITKNLDAKRVMIVPGYLDHYLDHLKKMPVSIKQYLAAIMGHIPFGDPLFNHFEQKSIRTTLLRDPISRAISEYKYVMHVDKNHPHRQSIIKNQHTLVDYIINADLYGDKNMMTHYLCGCLCDPERKHVALNNLEQNFTCFGIVEEFEQFIVLLSQLMNISDIHSPIVNQSPHVDTNLTDSEKNQIEESLSEDTWLYNNAKNIFRMRIKELTPKLIETASLLRKTNQTITPHLEPFKDLKAQFQS